MAKRRNVIMGLGALAFGSGALSSVAGFSGNLADPESDFRVIADSELVVRSTRDSSGAPIVRGNNDDTSFSGTGSRTLGSGDVNITDTGYSSDYSSFKSDNLNPLISSVGQPAALGAELNQEANNQLAIRLGVSLGLNEDIDPFVEVTNNTNTEYLVKFNYGENDDSTTSDEIINSNDGYGADVTSGNSDFTGANSGEVSRQLVQEVFQWRLDGSDYSTGRNTLANGGLSNTSGASADGDLVSPDPDASNTDNAQDEARQGVYLNGGETVFVKLDFNTDSGTYVTNLKGKINSLASGSNAFTDNATVDLLDTVYVEAE